MSYSLGGYSYWAREVLQIPGMINKTFAEGHDDDVLPKRLLFAEKTDGTTGGANTKGTNYYTILDKAAIVPIVGGDLLAGPFISSFEGTLVFTCDVQTDLFPTVVLRTTHKIAGMPDIVSIRVVPIEGLLIGINITSKLGLNEFNSIVNLRRDVPDGGKIGLKIEFAVVFHTREIGRNMYVRKIQAGLPITDNAASLERPVLNRTFSMAFINPAVSFLQITKAVKANSPPASPQPVNVELGEASMFNRETLLDSLVSVLSAQSVLNGWTVMRNKEGVTATDNGKALYLRIGDTEADREDNMQVGGRPTTSVTGATYRTTTPLVIEAMGNPEDAPAIQAKSLEAIVDPIIQIITAQGSNGICYNWDGVTNPAPVEANNQRRTMTISFSLSRVARY